MTNFKASAKDLSRRFWWVYVIFITLLVATHPPLNQILRLTAFIVFFTIACIMEGKWNLDDKARNDSKPLPSTEE